MSIVRWNQYCVSIDFPWKMYSWYQEHYEKALGSQVHYILFVQGNAKIVCRLVSISIASFLFCWCFHHNFVSGCLLKCSMFPIQCVCSTFSHPTNRPLNRSHNALSKYIIIWFALPLLLHQIHFVFGSFRKLFFWTQHLNAWMGPVIWLRFSYFFSVCLPPGWKSKYFVTLYTLPRMASHISSSLLCLANSS